MLSPMEPIGLGYPFKIIPRPNPLFQIRGSLDLGL
jgi:hypothetical protein